MPAGDGTGPRGMGPMTGRGMGSCGGNAQIGLANPVPGQGRGMGFGWGRGRGRGWRHQAHATGLPFWARTPVDNAPTPMVTEPPIEYQAQTLKAQAEQMEKSLEQLRKRITELEAVQSKDA